MLRGCLAFVICNSVSIHSLYSNLTQRLFTHWKCAPPILWTFHKFILIFWHVLNLDIFPPERLRGCLVCVICNSNSVHSFIFKLYIMIVHTLKMWTSYFVRLFHCFFSFLTGVESRHFPHLSVHPQHFWGCQVCVICNSKSFNSF